MENVLTDVVVHVNENLSEEAMRCIEQDMRKDDGVISVGRPAGQSHLWMVVYDSEFVPAASLLQPFQAHGLHAQLIGF